MLNFTYCVPTKVVFGRGTEKQAGKEVLACGGRRVLIVYGGKSAKASGVLDCVEDSLRRSGLFFAELGGVQPNPRLSKVYEGIELAKQERIDFLLAVGGGSAIDTAKAIGYALGSPNEDVWDFFIKKSVPKGCMPIGVVLTISASGSEASNSCVITNEKTGLKRSCNMEFVRPRFAIMNPELTYTLPPYQTAAGGVDIMMHTQERYFANEPHTELTLRIAEGLLVTVKESLPIALAQPDNYDARAELMWAGSLSHNDLTGLGRVPDYTCHKIEHELSGLFDVNHGAGLAAIWGSWARFVMHHDVALFARFAVRVMGCPMNERKPEATAEAGIAAMEDFYRSIGMPANLKELGLGHITDEQIAEMADKCTYHDTIKAGMFCPASAKEVEQILKNARG